MALVLITEATGPCVTLDEIKTHLRLSTSDTSEDLLLNSMLMAAQNEAENKTKRAMMPQTWELVMDAFPEGGIEIPRPPLSSNSTDLSISYIDSSGATATLSATAYSIDGDSEPAWVVPSYDNDWPETYDVMNAVRVRYKCGYALSGASTATTPYGVKAWVRLRVGAMYNNRESLSVESGAQTMLKLPRTFVDGLLDAYTVIKI